MIKLKSLIVDNKEIQMTIDKNGGFDDWRDDDDNNMNDEEFEEFQDYLNGWLKDIGDKKERDRISQLTKKVVDVDELIVEFLLMNEEDRQQLKDKSSDETNKIRKILKDKRKKGQTCYFYKRYGIKYLGDNNLFHKMLDWEIDYYNRHHRKNTHSNNRK